MMVFLSIAIDKEKDALNVVVWDQSLHHFV